MDFILDDNDYSDGENNEVEELPEWFLKEQEYMDKLTKINKFKNDIDTESTFYGIKNVKDGEILELMESIDYKKNSKKNNRKNNNILSDYHIELFDDIHVALFGTKKSYEIYNNIAKNILKKCKI